MKMHIREFAKLTGVSVRTLHYYDEIGLLKPSFVDGQNGYRFYDERCLERMQEILFYRELDFPLKDIGEILSAPDYDKQTALKEQRRLLILKKERLERLITALDGVMKGENLSMNIFDNSEYEAQCKQYAKEAKEKWGSTEAYKESAEKTKDYSKEKWSNVSEGMDALMAEFAECRARGSAPESDEAQALVKKWQNYITENFYTCTKEILAGLGKMYIADDRFKENIDKHGKGTAEFMCHAIGAYCR
ncbi:MAG: MerR family transcriptional regulator [Prevotella sp.]|nr:MerR family transcriptional regulator [Prevotella sp.]